MEKEFDVSCPKCKAVFRVPIELGGEVAECAECESVFEIPRPAPAEIRDIKESEKLRVYELGTPPNSHGTAKLSRTSIGMIPIIKDRFLSKSKPLPPRN
ncbi:MAG: hypothetical protein WC637_15925 [Victivallales bacterium]|jgi:hypothetical protein